MMQKHTQAGFTITELVVVIAVFALILPAVADIIASVDTINDRGRDEAIVSSAVENKAEAIRSLGYDALTTGTTTDFTSELSATIGAPRSASYTVSTESTDLKKIDISVSYKANGNTRVINYKTFIGKAGVGQL